ncbi:unnamed protein product [Mytilus edulis]|uniref:TRAF-type domain-containing protein n=1 Tax=Mytilus edulis TaxID=6550 RepID=A0A8S3SN54_MYTED|nr:unnamed protein product [Mytilus edulis]
MVLKQNFTIKQKIDDVIKDLIILAHEILVLLLLVLMNHKETCDHEHDEPRECPNRNDGCQETLSFKDMTDHITNHCLYSLVPCPDCQSPVMRKDLQNHQDDCTRYPITCKFHCDVGELPREEFRLPECLITFCACVSFPFFCNWSFFTNSSKDPEAEDLRDSVNTIIRDVNKVTISVSSQTQGSLTSTSRLRGLSTDNAKSNTCFSQSKPFVQFSADHQ